MNRKKWLIFIAVAVLIIGGGAWWFGFGQNHSNSGDVGLPQVPVTVRPQAKSIGNAEKKVIIEAATQLVAKLTSTKLATYKEAWVAGEQLPPTAPLGTKITVDASSVQSYEAFRRVEGEMVVPGKSPVRIVIYLTSADFSGQWRAVHVEEVK